MMGEQRTTVPFQPRYFLLVVTLASHQQRARPNQEGQPAFQIR